MDFVTCMAAVAVADLDAATDFYRRLFDREPDREPMPTLAQWDLPGGSAFQVVQDDERAGRSMATLVVGDVTEVQRELQERGLSTGEVVDGALSRLFQTRDPWGNLLTLVEPA